MGQSGSKTFRFFEENFGDNQSFLIQEDCHRILFSLDESSVTEESFLVNAEVLLRPKGASQIAIRTAENTRLNTDVGDYKPTATFRVFYSEEGFHDLVFNTTDKGDIKLISDLAYLSESGKL